MTRLVYAATIERGAVHVDVAEPFAEGTKTVSIKHQGRSAFFHKTRLTKGVDCFDTKLEALKDCLLVAQENRDRAHRRYEAEEELVRLAFNAFKQEETK